MDTPTPVDLLPELLVQGRARPGLTLVAVYAVDTWELQGFVRLNTPKPPEGDGAERILADRMSPTLAQIAHLFVPCRPQGASRSDVPPTHTLVTVVCREGEPVPTAAEEQYVQAWQTCDDSTSARHGNVYLLTPDGWACLQGGEGDDLYLVLGADSYAPDDDVIEFPPLLDLDALESDPSVAAAEEVLAAALAEDFATLAALEPDECLACYVTRMVFRYGCDGTWRFVEHHEGVSGGPHTAEQEDWRREGECDCAVYELGFDLADDVEEPVEHLDAGVIPVVLHHEWPWPNPHPCQGVGDGPGQRCRLWQPLDRALW